MIVRLKSSNPDYHDLSEGQSYCVIGIEADDYRIINDAGKPYLYPPDIFDVIDTRHPPDWITVFGEDGERYSYPPPLNEEGFFEDFFDHQHTQVSIFWQVVNQTLSKAA
jgi:hypothetical protein